LQWVHAKLLNSSMVTGAVAAPSTLPEPVWGGAAKEGSSAARTSDQSLIGAF
jgi:hypothetical protein